MNAPVTSLNFSTSNFEIVEPVLRKALMEAERDHQELQEVFELMGWGSLPEELKIEIGDDIRAFREELYGNYSTCDPAVLRRRRRVRYWVELYLDGACSLRTAVESLRVRSL